MKTYISKYKIKTKKNVDIKIAHISDIHYDEYYNLKRFDLIYKDLLKIKPNYICITGDLVDNNLETHKDKIKNLYDFFEKLGTICVVLITLGNHDLETIIEGSRAYEYPFKFVKELKKLKNVKLLENDLYIDKNINFVGYNPVYKYYTKLELDFSLFENKFNIKKFKLSKNAYNILLTHTTVGLLAFENNIIDNFDLILSGHTHGGMLPSWLFGNRGLISPSKLIFPHNMRGHKKVRDTDIIICSGIYKLPKTSKLQKFNNLYAMDINEIIINKKR